MSLTIKDYREMHAKFGGTKCKCGHVIRLGEVIGWSPKDRGNAVCSACWVKWNADVQAENDYESTTGYMFADTAEDRR